MKRPVCLWNETRGFRPRGRNPQTSSPDLSVHDRVESDQGVQRRSRSQRVVQVWRRVQIRKTRYGGAVEREAGDRVAMEGHVIKHYHLHQVRNVVAGGTAGRIDGAVGIEAADLQTQFRVGLPGNRLAGGAVNQEISRRDALIVSGPDALATPAYGAVDHAVARERTIAKDIDHDRLADSRSIFQTSTDAVAEVQIARLTIHSVARVIVESTHFDGACGRVAVDDQFHDGGGLLVVGIALELRRSEYSTRTHDLGILARVDRAGTAVRIDGVSRLGVVAAYNPGGGGTRTQRRGIELGVVHTGHRSGRNGISLDLPILGVADALHRLQYIGHVGGIRQQRAELTGADQALGVRGAGYLGGLRGRNDHGRRRHGTAARH